MSYGPLDPQGDPFHPPEVPTEVSCLHCGEVYDSYLIEWRVETDAGGKQHGFWCCPTPGCGGMGFGFDILPTDPHYRDERGGWVGDEDDDFDDEFDEDDFGDDDEAFDEDLDDEDDFDEIADSDRPLGPGRSSNGNGRSDRPMPDDEIPF